jgi:alpha-glucosidase (family GH31 glycosyl hydrolase)
MRLLTLLLCTGALAGAAPLTVKENADSLAVAAGGYELTVDRAGFGFTVNRGGRVVLQAPRLRTTLKMFAHRVEGDRLIVDYAVPRKGAGVTLGEGQPEQAGLARVEIAPRAKSIGFTLWRLDADNRPAPGFQIRLAPSGQWYGGGFQGWREPQIFPLNAARIKPRWFLAEGNSQGTPAWYATAGVAVWVRTPHDLMYSINHNGDGLLAVEMPAASALAWDVIVEGNIRDAARHIVSAIGLPKTTPPADYFKLPIYTTWVEHKTTVSQEKVLEYARAIRSNKLPCGVIEIDDRWEVRYGDMEFDKTKFPDPRRMTEELHKQGFRVTLWVHPFVNADSRAFADPAVRRHLLRDRNGRVGLTRWWQGIAGLWDFSDPAAAAAFRARLVGLQKRYGLDGFKFDGGDPNLTPPDFVARRNITPAEYGDVYNREATAHFAWEETRVGVLTQPTGVVQRLIDKHSVWGLNNGFAAIVPEAITVSVRGFAYLMPDMIGGNEYDNDRIDAELLIRWAQASALMPLMQFSKGPWHLGEEATRLSREASELHVRFAPYIVALARKFPTTGDPILRPLWYNTPDDGETHKISDQFMLGADVVVAPVLAKGAVKRRLYLPAGEWKELKGGRAQQGARWIEVDAPLDTLPVFVRAGSEAAKL